MNERETLIADLSINAVDGFFYITKSFKLKLENYSLNLSKIYEKIYEKVYEKVYEKEYPSVTTLLVLLCKE